MNLIRKDNDRREELKYLASTIKAENDNFRATYKGFGNNVDASTFDLDIVHSKNLFRKHPLLETGHAGLTTMNVNNLVLAKSSIYLEKANELTKEKMFRGVLINNHKNEKLVEDIYDRISKRQSRKSVHVRKEMLKIADIKTGFDRLSDNMEKPGILEMVKRNSIKKKFRQSLKHAVSDEFGKQIKSIENNKGTIKAVTKSLIESLLGMSGRTLESFKKSEASALKIMYETAQIYSYNEFLALVKFFYKRFRKGQENELEELKNSKDKLEILKIMKVPILVKYQSEQKELRNVDRKLRRSMNSILMSHLKFD